MNPSRERQKIVYNNLFKKYFYHLKKVAKQKNRNLLLKSTNNELLKKVIRLREETQKSTARNSNLKAEIYDIAMDRKTIVENNQKLYDSLAILHKDALAIEKKLFSMLDRSSNSEFYARHSSFQMPVVNGQVIKNPKENVMPPETSYQKYNFKDCVYVQDLSPIMEENDKPNDVTRRLGHRGKVMQPYTSPGKFGNQSVSVLCEEDDENSNSSALHMGQVEVEKEKNQLENQFRASEPAIASTSSMNNSGEQLSSAVYNELNNISVVESIQTNSCLSEPSSIQNSAILSNESVPQMSESPVLTINLLPQSESETTINDLDYRPSIFVNVFPRRRKRNDPGCSSTIEEEGDSKHHQEPNSTYNELEDTILRKCSLRSSKSSLDQSTSEIQSNLSSENNLTINHETKKKKITSKLSLESSSNEQDSVSNSSKGEKIKKRGRPAKSNSSFIESSSNEQDSISKSSKGVKIKKRGRPAKFNKSSIETSVGCSPNKKSSMVSLKKIKNGDKVTSQSSSERISGQSVKTSTSSQKNKNESISTSQRSNERISFKSSCSEQDSPSKSSRDQSLECKEKSPKTSKRSSNESSIESTPNKKASTQRVPCRSSPRISHSLKSQEEELIKGSRKALRTKKYINLAESPMISVKNGKRRKKNINA